MPTFEPFPNPGLNGVATTQAVVRYHRDRDGDNRFEIMPNVVCEEIHYTKGPVVPTARFRYLLDNRDRSTPYPYSFEELWPLSAVGPYVVQADDELLVWEFAPDGTQRVVFDGFAQMPQTDLGGGQPVTFAATGVGIRLWDQPIKGAVYRDASDPTSTDLDHLVATDLPVWFNPAGKPNALPNATPDGYDRNEGSPNACPVFLEAELPQLPGATPVVPAPWTLGSFIRYLFWQHNPSEKWVKNPKGFTGVSLDDYLVAVTPKTPPYMDLSKPSTYTTAPIVIRSFDASNKALVEAASEQLAYYGFDIFFNCRGNSSDPGAPINELILYRVDGRDGYAPKALFYPPEGAFLSDGIPDFAELSLARDHAKPHNEIEIETAEIEYEASFVLVPGFSISATDPDNLPLYDLKGLANATGEVRKKYRWFIFDELGLGHWSMDSNSWVTGTPASFNEVLGEPEGDFRQYVYRFRPGDHKLFSLDSAGQPRKADLSISRDYSGLAPQVWDGTGTWSSLGQSGWKLLDKQLGIELTCDNPDNFKMPKQSDAAFGGDILHVIRSLAVPGGFDTKFYFRLTTVIKGDQRIAAVAAKRDASPMRFAVRRVLEAKDHLAKHVIDTSSMYNLFDEPDAIRDDTSKALAHAQARRLAGEFPSIAGQITIPWISHAIGVGDLISYINGREVNLLTNAGAPAGEGPQYPAVVGFSWSYGNPQRTVLKLSDRRAEIEGESHGFARAQRQ